jgi:hypothetical protein
VSSLFWKVLIDLMDKGGADLTLTDIFFFLPPNYSEFPNSVHLSCMCLHRLICASDFILLTHCDFSASCPNEDVVHHFMSSARFPPVSSLKPFFVIIGVTSVLSHIQRKHCGIFPTNHSPSYTEWKGHGEERKEKKRGMCENSFIFFKMDTLSANITHYY